MLEFIISAPHISISFWYQQASQNLPFSSCGGGRNVREQAQELLKPSQAFRVVTIIVLAKASHDQAQSKEA